ncbi:hypothetical protein [Nocardioides alkalitolerans]|uniref:hypothetical protein n=1 Tax=Nocardioides alkalitolerans TaxID=281714 RepID=UPI00040584B2|nr:hypothetical protein [Nocardioides alkalitolerans]
MSEHPGTDPTTQPMTSYDTTTAPEDTVQDDNTRYDTRYETAVDDPTDAAGGRHPVNVGHLVMGVAFLGLVVVWALVTVLDLAGGDLRWLLPLPWLAAGGAGLAAAALTARRRSA